jgi:thioredoxin 1
MALLLESRHQMSQIMVRPEVKTISGQQLIDTVVDSKANAVVKLFTEWSGASQLLGFALLDFANQYHGKIEFFQVDIDADPALTDHFRIDLLPTLLFFKEGKLVDKLSGLNQRKTISSKINQIINQ